MKMVKVKTAKLAGKALDWVVAKAVGMQIKYFDDLFEITDKDSSFWEIFPFEKYIDECTWQPTKRWDQGGPLAEEYAADFEHVSDATIRCFNYINNGDGRGPTHLVALCRSVVQGHLGDEVEVPEVLL